MSKEPYQCVCSLWPILRISPVKSPPPFKWRTVTDHGSSAGRSPKPMLVSSRLLSTNTQVTWSWLAYFHYDGIEAVVWRHGMRLVSKILRDAYKLKNLHTMTWLCGTCVPRGLNINESSILHKDSAFLRMISQPTILDSHSFRSVAGCDSSNWWLRAVDDTSEVNQKVLVLYSHNGKSRSIC